MVEVNKIIKCPWKNCSLPIGKPETGYCPEFVSSERRTQNLTTNCISQTQHSLYLYGHSTNAHYIQYIQVLMELITTISSLLVMSLYTVAPFPSVPTIASPR